MQTPNLPASLDQGFNLDDYRVLLDRLQQSKRRQEEMDRNSPLTVPQQPQ
jgi:hypothetical protein